MNSVNWPAPSVWVFIAQLVEHCSANAEATGSSSIEAPKKLSFFSGYIGIASHSPFINYLEELVGRKWQMAPNRMFQQLTDKTKKKQEIFKNFVSDDGNESLQYNPPLPP